MLGNDFESRDGKENGFSRDREGDNLCLKGRVVHSQGEGVQATLCDDSRSKRAYLVQASCLLFSFCLKVPYASLYTVYALTPTLKINVSSNSPFGTG